MKHPVSAKHCGYQPEFRDTTKQRLAKFNGVRADFEMHLKGCEWRWARHAHQRVMENTAAIMNALFRGSLIVYVEAAISCPA